MYVMKKRAIIIIGHGSAQAGATECMAQLMEALQKHFSDCIVENCFISKSEPLLPETVDKCVAAGAADITVIPYLLLNGFHVVKDIPEMIEAQKKKHPSVVFKYGDYIGYDDLMAQLLIKRIDAAG